MRKAKLDNDRIAIDLQNGKRLVIEQNRDPMFEKEVFVALERADGMWLQDIAIVRSAYHMNGCQEVVWSKDKLEVLVYADENDEDYTNKFSIGIRKEE